MNCIYNEYDREDEDEDEDEDMYPDIKNNQFRVISFTKSKSIRQYLEHIFSILVDIVLEILRYRIDIKIIHNIYFSNLQREVSKYTKPLKDYPTDNKDLGKMQYIYVVKDIEMSKYNKVRIEYMLSRLDIVVYHWILIYELSEEEIIGQVDKIIKIIEKEFYKKVKQTYK